jgi:enoyl-CoA hydratase/carnithine racemase
MHEATARLSVNTQVPGYWRVTIDNPPINTIDNLMYDEIFDLMQAIDAEQGLKVVTFESANPDYFLAHYGVGESRSRFGVPRWRDAATQLAHSNVLSIAVIRGRARGGGSEFALACDVRFASRERAIFGQPEVGFGLIPGGGALERLPLLVGRSRAIEIALGAEDFDADTAERYGWINRAVPETELDGFVNGFVNRVRSFDAQALATAKQRLNQTFVADPAQLEATGAAFVQSLGWLPAMELMARARERGLNTASPFELDLGRAVAELSQPAPERQTGRPS